jgi:uncharacterized membrane protein YccF (DUF307 family)
MNKIFEDENNVPSSMRVIYFITIFTIMFTWSYLSIYNKQLLPFDATQVSILAISFAGKVGQKHFEVKEKLELNKSNR